MVKKQDKGDLNAPESVSAPKKEVKPKVVKEKKAPLVTQDAIVATVKALGGSATLKEVRVKLGIEVKTGNVWNTEVMRIEAAKAVAAGALKIEGTGRMQTYQLPNYVAPPPAPAPVKEAKAPKAKAKA